MPLTPAEIQKRYRERHPDKIKAYGKRHYWENPEKEKERRKKRYYTVERNKWISFKGKAVFLKENPRKGICSKCGDIGRTDMHHLEYDENNPLAHTIELCRRCHIKTDKRYEDVWPRRNRDSKGRFI